VRGLFRGILLAWTLAVVLPLLAADDKAETKDKPETKEKPEVKDRMVSAGAPLTAKMARLPGTDKNMTLSVPVGRNWQNVEMPLVDDVKVRLRNPPANFDDKGKPKKYTQKELAELKGPDKKLPGYTGALEDLKSGQIVTVYLVKKAGPLPKGVTAKEIPPEYKPQVSMIVIEREAPGK
jgi:hypothetical protein